ncbi:MAG: hypothetical protein Q9168_000866 [Polycauliona sp. 1 TL-2023]
MHVKLLLKYRKALKFLPNRRILPEELSSPFIEYLNPRSTLAPPFPSPLAARLLGIDGISAVFYGPDFITITKAADANWAHVKPEVFSLITEVINSGERIVTASERDTSDAVRAGGGTQDSLAYDETDSEVVGMIKELLQTRIRPAIQDDGGDVDFCGFENGKADRDMRAISKKWNERCHPQYGPQGHLLSTVPAGIVIRELGCTQQSEGELRK